MGRESFTFFKMQGCGNDFVAIDNREYRIPVAVMPEWARKTCARAFGICADGLFFLENAPAGSGLDYCWNFYNADGSRAEMCGNASRCAAKLAQRLGLAPAKQLFGTDAGPIRAEVITSGPDAGQVKVRLTPPSRLELHKTIFVNDDPVTVHFVNTGVPHAVVLVNDVASVDVPTLGLTLRYHEAFAPAGTNVNFVQTISPTKLLLRTYERGVEAETYACGTGAAASQLVAHRLGLTGPSAKLTTTGGEVLTVHLDEAGIQLQGNATLVFTGEASLQALGLTLP